MSRDHAIASLLRHRRCDAEVVADLEAMRAPRHDEIASRGYCLEPSRCDPSPRATRIDEELDPDHDSEAIDPYPARLRVGRRPSACVRRQNSGVQFSPDLRDRVADGTITVSYRLWSRPKVRADGVYRSGSVMIEIDEIELLPFASITDEDLARTGEPDVETLRRRAAHAGPIDDDTLVYRVEFHVVGPPDDTVT
jgi:hypothetical protein